MHTTDENGNPITIYQPNERQGGIIWCVQQAWGDIWIGRYVIIQLFKRDFVVQFKQTILGYIWAIITPLLGIVSFLYLYFIGVLTPGVTDMPYPLYVLIGSNIWATFSGTMGAVSGGLQAQADLVMRTNIPKLALAISSLASIVYGILISMVTMGLIFFFYGIWPSPWFLVYPLLTLPLLLLGIALGLILAVLSSIARDIVKIVTQGVAFLAFITPIYFLPESISNPVIKALITFNPFSYMVDLPRSLIYSGTAQDVGIYLLVTLGFIILFVIGLRFFYLIDDLVAERL